MAPTARTAQRSAAFRYGCKWHGADRPGGSLGRPGLAGVHKGEPMSRAPHSWRSPGSLRPRPTSPPGRASDVHQRQDRGVHEAADAHAGHQRRSGLGDVEPRRTRRSARGVRMASRQRCGHVVSSAALEASKRQCPGRVYAPGAQCGGAAPPGSSGATGFAGRGGAFAGVRRRSTEGPHRHRQSRR